MALYSQLSNHDFIELLRAKSQAERALNVEVIDLLEEMERRRLYLEMGFGSLMEYCVKDLRYSESAAYRRIAAMRVSRELPEVKKALTEGTLNLMSVTQAQTLFSAEAKNSNTYSTNAKRNLLKSLENKSKREVEKILIEESPVALVKEQIKVHSSESFRVQSIIPNDLMKKLERVKSLTTHKNPNPSFAELINLLADIALAKLDPDRTVKPRKRTAKPPVVRRRSISAETKRLVWRKAQDRCTYVDPDTTRRCESRHQLEIDHIIPFAKGGTNEPENLRLVCRQHNYLFARKHFGSKHMNQFSRADRKPAENEEKAERTVID
jgi:hypothetical protein